jgi:uncharacterized membrane protein YjjP (DUF1212 family)
MSNQSALTKLLAQAGRLLLEYNESTGAIHDALMSTAKALAGATCRLAVSYGGVALALDGEPPVLEPVRELRYNTALQAQVHQILAQVRQGHLDAASALTRLERLETDTARHPPWVGVFVLAFAAAGLAALLGADTGTTAVAALGTGLGLLARQELARRHFSLLTLPLAAAFIGAMLGGLAIRMNWTATPDLVLIVPAIMLVPGPHLINGLLDLIDNFLPMSLARLGLAAGILAASALGVVLGMELVLPDSFAADHAIRTDHLNLISDMALAGIVTCGFAVYYNTPWSLVPMAAVGGVLGHGIRFLALDWGCRPEAAAFLGGLMVGIGSGWMARTRKTPVAVIAFAGAVTMMPGLNLYRALGGAVQLAWSGARTEPVALAATLGNALQAVLIIVGLALGLILGARAVLAIFKTDQVSSSTSLGLHHVFSA